MTGPNSPCMARDVMTPDPVCVSPSTTIRELARVLEVNEISGAPVVDAQGALVGVVSKTDLIRRCSEGSEAVPPAYLFEILSQRPGGDLPEPGVVVPEPLICVDDFMTADPITVLPTTPIREVAHLMHSRAIHRVVVVDDERYPVGIITSLDVIRALAEPARTERPRRGGRP